LYLRWKKMRVSLLYIYYGMIPIIWVGIYLIVYRLKSCCCAEKGLTLGYHFTWSLSESSCCCWGHDKNACRSHFFSSVSLKGRLVEAKSSGPSTHTHTKTTRWLICCSVCISTWDCKLSFSFFWHLVALQCRLSFHQGGQHSGGQHSHRNRIIIADHSQGSP